MILSKKENQENLYKPINLKNFINLTQNNLDYHKMNVRYIKTMLNIIQMNI
jgi:hypothetical protein